MILEPFLSNIAWSIKKSAVDRSIKKSEVDQERKKEQLKEPHLDMLFSLPFCNHSKCQMIGVNILNTSQLQLTNYYPST